MRWRAARAESPPELMDHFFALAFFVFFAFAFFAFLAIVSSSFAGRRFGEAGLRPHTIVESPDSVGLSAKEPMNLVDKRLDKATAPRLLWSGGIEARIGLRMMPTFPRSSLSFRTAGFPQYGWKAGISGGTFPKRQSA
jgi:hypothetical protein